MFGGNAGREQHRVLRDEGDGAAAVGEADVGEVVSVDVDGARLRRVKTGEQRGDGRFAAARLANEGDGFAGTDVQVETLQHRLLRIGKADVAKFDVAACKGNGR